MTTPKIIIVAKYFTLLTFLVSTILVTLMYFSPSSLVENSSALFGILFVGSTIILLSIIVAKAISLKTNRRPFIFASTWLICNATVFFCYFLIWNFAANTILIKITNNTGYKVTEAGIYGCFAQSWGQLANKESKTVRFPANYDCAFAVTYKLNGKTRLELLPRQMGVKNKYFLGTNPSSAPDTKAANTSFIK